MRAKALTASVHNCRKSDWEFEFTTGSTKEHCPAARLRKD